jgi:hypothetical protein
MYDVCIYIFLFLRYNIVVQFSKYHGIKVYQTKKKLIFHKKKKKTSW